MSNSQQPQHPCPTCNSYKYAHSHPDDKKIIVSEPLTDSQSNRKGRCNRLILILDESGSMDSQRHDIIGGINTMIRQQREVEPHRNREVHFDIVKFSDTVKPVRSETLADIKEFTDYDYQPTGCTALFDAIGSTIQKHRDEKNVVLVIATDGQENSSRNYTYREITRMITEQRENNGWHILYLSEDIDTFAQGDRIGCSNVHKQSYNACVQKSSLGKCFQQESYNTGIAQMRQGFDADFSSISSQVPLPPKKSYSSRNPVAPSGPGSYSKSFRPSGPSRYRSNMF